MEDYRLEQTGQEVQDILNGAAMQTELAAETERATSAEQTLLGNIEAEELARQQADAALQEYADGKVSDEADARQQADELLMSNIDAEEFRAKAAEQANATDIETINGKIPAEASAENKLVDNAALQGDYYTKAAVNNLIQGLGQNDVIVGELPSTGTANTIYRVPGDGEYSDYMWYDGAWQLLATYSANIQGCQYIGIATPTTNPGTPSNNVFYFAHEAGIYTNFGSLAVTQGINILKFDGTSWTLEQLVGIAQGSDFDNPDAAKRAKVATVGAVLDGCDAEPTAGSVKPVQSGGVYDAVRSIVDSCAYELADLNITDDDGNILLQLANGNIRTKNFDSTKDATVEYSGLMSSDDKAKLNGIEEGAEVNNIDTTESEADLNIADEDDNILLQLANGHIRTKYFNSASANVYKHFTIKPSWIGGNPIKVVPVNSIFEFGVDSTNALNLIHTKLFNVCPGSEVIFDCTITTVTLTALFYKEDYRFISAVEVHQSGDNWDGTSVIVPSNARMMILQASSTDSSQNVLHSIDLTMNCSLNPACITSFFPRNADSGYQHLSIAILLTDMKSNSYTPSNELEVETEYYIDHGVLCLPSSYTTDGEPTRLICFTHGHAVNYTQNSTRFNSKDIKPEYWLSEGYAIFDMDGTVTGTFSGNHDFEQAVTNAYDTAYQWIVRHFNIRTDGVFTTGRSQGGGMQFVLAKRSTMPIIASAPIVPYASPLGYLDTNNGAAIKELLVDYGVPQAEVDAIATWSNSYYYNQSSAVKQIICDNQWRWCQFTPGWFYNRPLTVEELTSASKIWWGKQDGEIESFYNSVKDSINISVFRNIPFRIYTCVGDPLIWYKAVELLNKELSNAGSLTQIHVFPATATPIAVDGDHRFEINEENLVTYTNSDGVVLQDVPKVYIEILAFWKRFENQDFNYN